MAEGDFKPIESQEELDRIIKDRLQRERDASNKRYEGWISPEDHQRGLNDSVKAFDDYKKAHEGDAQTIEDLKVKIQEYETASLKNRIAHEVGLSYEWVARISGTDEESIRTDAQSLKKLVGSGNPLPTKSTETDVGDPKAEAMRAVLNGIKK